jgi:hypothetical protein
MDSIPFAAYLIRPSGLQEQDEIRDKISRLKMIVEVFIGMNK